MYMHESYIHSALFIECLKKKKNNHLINSRALNMSNFAMRFGD